MDLNFPLPFRNFVLNKTTIFVSIKNNSYVNNSAYCKCCVRNSIEKHEIKWCETIITFKSSLSFTDSVVSYTGYTAQRAPSDANVTRGTTLSPRVYFD